MVSKKKPLGISLTELNKIEPITENQKEVFASYSKGQNLFLYGVAGTGKTFVALYNALKDVLDPKSPRERVYIVRSLLPTRDIGFYLAMKKTSLTYIKCRIKTWYDLCLNNQMKGHLINCIII